MFTVSFVCQRVFSLLGLVNCQKKNVASQINVHYFILRGVYKLLFDVGVTQSSYFIQTCSALRKLSINDAYGFNAACTVVMFRINRLGSYYAFNTHSTNRNSDVLYLDRFTGMIQAQIVRRVVGIYSITSWLTAGTQSDWIVRFSPTSIVKYVNSMYTDIFNVLYLRKTKVFNKGRYSRNRQFYRTGVYWCLYINIIAVIGMYFWFYRFVMNFGYLWWLFYLSLASFVVAKTIHFRLYTIMGLWNSITADIVWFAACLNTFIFGAIRTNNIQIFKNFSSATISCSIARLCFVINTLRIQSNLYYVFMWFYNPTNYYVQSLTINPARVFLSSGKISYFSQFRDLLLK